MMAPTFGKPPQADPPQSPRETLPTMYDLPSEDPEEPGLPDDFHHLQPQLLSRTIRLAQYARSDFYTGSDLNLYYDVNHPLWYKRPDWFLAVGVPRLYDGQDLRRSYVVWQEGQSPYVAIEFLSPGTELEDLGRFHEQADPEAVDAENEVVETNGKANGNRAEMTRPPAKLEVYESYLRIPHYLVYSRYTRQLRYFKLDGGRYQEQPLRPELPKVWIAELDIGLGVWAGEFEGIPGHWLRWCDEAGRWLLTDTEQSERRADQERLAREQEQIAKEQAQAQLLQAARNLIATGMEVNQVAELLNLTENQLRELE